MGKELKEYLTTHKTSLTSIQGLTEVDSESVLKNHPRLKRISLEVSPLIHSHWEMISKQLDLQSISFHNLDSYLTEVEDETSRITLLRSVLTWRLGEGQ